MKEIAIQIIGNKLKDKIYIYITLWNDSNRYLITHIISIQVYYYIKSITQHVTISYMRFLAWH